MHVFHLEQEEYQREGLSWESIAFKDNSSCIQLIEGVIHKFFTKVHNNLFFKI